MTIDLAERGSSAMKRVLMTGLTTAGLMIGSAAIAPFAMAQRVVDVAPAPQGQQITPDASISGVFDTAGTPAVDVNSVRIFVNGDDVTNRSTITRSFFSYRPSQPFSPGQNQVRVEFSNANGNRQAATWSFTVQPPQSVVQINSVTHNASQALGSGGTLLATINGTPGGRGRVLLIQDGRTVRELPAQEVSSGVYVASLNVQASDRIQEGIVIGRLERQGQTVFAAAEQPVVLTASAQTGGQVTTTPIGQSNGTGTTGTGTTGTGTTGTGTTSPTTGTVANLKPTFTSHNNGDRVSGGGFTLVGQTSPNATVEVVTSRLAALGGLINLAGQTLVNQQVTADANGRFSVQVAPPDLPAPGTRYTVRATARQGNQSSTTEIGLTQR
jgi:hypothetical protein